MKIRRLIFLMLCAGAATASQSQGVVTLSSLQDPTLQTLIDLGSSGVSVGTDQFYNFGFVAGSATEPTSASQIQVEPTGGNGLEFFGGWLAANGSEVSDVISYDMAAIAPAKSPTSINLFSNGTAPAPVAGTFTTTTLSAQTLGGAAVGSVLSTYNDGVTSPVDTTKPDVNYASTTFLPQDALQITDAIFAASTPISTNNNGGVATISVIQNSFGAVPEPSMLPWGIIPAILLAGGASRRRRRRLVSAAMTPPLG